MISWLQVSYPTGWLLLGIPFYALPRRAGVRGDSRVDADIPGDQPGRVGQSLQPGQDHRPHPGPLPTAEQPIDRQPRPIYRRHVMPRCASTHLPADPIDELPSGPRRRAARLLPDQQERLQHRPLRVGQIEPPRHHHAGHEVSGVLIVLVDDRSTGDLFYLTNNTPTQPSPEGKLAGQKRPRWSPWPARRRSGPAGRSTTCSG